MEALDNQHCDLRKKPIIKFKDLDVCRKKKLLIDNSIIFVRMQKSFLAHYEPISQFHSQ